MAQIVTITNPLTGQPAQVDQLDHTAQQIDDGLNIARGVSNPNLLDNWYFGNPVDQRGGYVVLPGSPYLNAGTFEEAGITTGYVKVNYLYSEGNASITVDGSEYVVAKQYVVRGYTGAGYGIDRWKHDKGSSGNGVVLLNENGITIKQGSTVYSAQSLHQIVENPQRFSGETVTLSMLVKGTHRSQVLIFQNGSVLKANSAVVNTEDWTLISLTATLSSTIANLSAFIYGDIGATVQDDYSTILAAKLELGSQQTLAHQDENGVWVLNEIPDYGEQLASCKRFLQRISSNGLIACKQLGVETKFTIVKSFDVEMADAPKVRLLKPITIYHPGNAAFITGSAISKYVDNKKGIQFAHVESDTNLSGYSSGFLGYGDNNDDVIEVYVEGLGG